MKPRTSQQLNALGCCPCPVPECVPRRECESISIDACGYTLPEHEDVTPEEACVLFRNKLPTSNLVSELTEYPGYNSFYLNDTENRSTTWKKVNSGGECIDVAASTHFDDTETTIATDGSDTTVVDSVASTIYDSVDGVCVGSYTFTDNLDAGNNESDSYTEGCSSIDYTPDDTWTKAGYTFTLTTLGEYADEALTVTYANPVNSSHLSEDIDDLIASLEGGSWPDEGCISSVQQERVFDESDPPELLCERLAGATKARYRFGIPDGFTGGTWEMEWDEVQAAQDWWDWYDGGMIGTEPTPGPSLVAHRSWTWAGDPGEPWSDWYELALPETPGETRTANVLTICYRSTRIGVLPTAYGDQIALPE